MKASELRQKSLEDLKVVQNSLQRESFILRMQKVTGQLSKSDQIQKVRRDIARLKTILTEKGKQK